MKKLIILVFGIVLFFSGCEEKSQKDVITIGAILPLSGDVASYGIDTKNGIDLAVKLANDTQNKYQFQVEYRDSKGSPKTAVTALQQLISFANPLAIIGENTSSSTNAMIPIIDKNKIILISPSASAPNLSGLSKYFFRVFPSDDAEGAFMSKCIGEQHKNGTVSILYINNDYGIGLKNVFKEKALINHLKIVSEDAFDKDMKNIKAMLAKIQKINPDAIYIPSYYENGGVLVKQIRELGIKSDIYGSTTHEDVKFLDIAGEASEGFQYPISTGYDENSQNKVVKDFISNYEKFNNKTPGLLTALGYDSVKVIIDAILLTKATTSDEIRSYILSTKDIQGTTGTMNFDEMGNVHKKIILKVVKNGEFVTK